MKHFAPKVDYKRRLVLYRFYAGVQDNNLYCYIINRITNKRTIDKRYKYLYAFGTDDFSDVGRFRHAQTGETVKVYKTAFKSVFKLRKKDKCNPVVIWKIMLFRKD